MYFHLPYARRIVYQRSEFKVEALPRQLPIIEISAFEERGQLFWTRFQVAVVCSSFSVLCSSSSPVLYTFSLVFLVFSTVFSVNTIQNSSPFMKWELKAMSSSTSQSRIWSVDCAKVMDNARFVSTSRNILTVGLLWRYTRRSRSSAVSRR